MNEKLRIYKIPRVSLKDASSAVAIKLDAGQPGVYRTLVSELAPISETLTLVKFPDSEDEAYRYHSVEANAFYRIILDSVDYISWGDVIVVERF